MKVLSFSLFCLCLALANPNIQVSLTEQTLNTALLTAYAFGLTTAHFYIGDFNYTLKMDLGDVDLRLTDINITSVSLNYAESLFALESPDLITYTIVDLEVDVTLGYDIKVALIPFKGKASAVVSNTNATVTVALSELQGKPQIAFKSAALVIGDLLIETQLPKEINDLLNDEVKKHVASLSKSLPNLLAANEPKLNTLLASLDLVIKCPVQPFAVDLSLYSNPSVLDNSTLVVGLLGTVLVEGQAVPGPTAVSMDVNAVVSEGLQAGISDYVVNAVLQPIWSTINLNVTELPSPLGNLTTTSLALMVPQLKWKYGNAPAMLNVYTTPTSYVNYWTHAGLLNLNGSASVDFWVYTQSNWVKALTLTMDFGVQAAAHITNNIGSATIKTVKLVKVVQANSQIGTVNTALLMNLVNSLAGAMVSELNPTLQNHVINLPDNAGDFVNTDDVKAATGYIVVGVDV